MLSRSDNQIWIILLPVALIVFLSLVLEPSWMTNDDAAMSMIAHGYGGISEASPNLIFSNIYWGKFIQQLPTIGGMYGYSLATMLSIAVSGICFAALLSVNTKSALTTSVVVTLILIQAVLFPQFTVTAGLISVTAVLALFQYSERKQYCWLIVACTCIFIGYIIRREETILICAIALPLLPWTSLLKQIRFLLVSGATLIVIVSVTVADHNSYDQPEWKTYQTLLPSLLPLIAYDAAPNLVARPQLLKKHGFSENDIKLLERWLWFDPEIASAERINALTNELGSATTLPLLGKQRIVRNWGHSIKISFTSLLDPAILFMLLCAASLLLIFPSKSLFTSWLIFFAALILMGAIGRPGELRVYFPVVSLLILAPLIINTKTRQNFRYKSLIKMTLIVFTVIHSALVVHASVKKTQASNTFREKLSQLPSDTIIAGYYSTFKASHVYSVLGAADLADEFDSLYLFGWPAIMPYSFAYRMEQTDLGFKKRLFSSEGVWILINNEELLRNYCIERDSKLTHLVKAGLSTGGAKYISCVAN